LFFFVFVVFFFVFFWWGGCFFFLLFFFLLAFLLLRFSLFSTKGEAGRPPEEPTRAPPAPFPSGSVWRTDSRCVGLRRRRGRLSDPPSSAPSPPPAIRISPALRPYPHVLTLIPDRSLLSFLCRGWHAPAGACLRQGRARGSLASLILPTRSDNTKVDSGCSLSCGIATACSRDGPALRAGAGRESDEGPWDRAIRTSRPTCLARRSRN